MFVNYKYVQASRNITVCILNKEIKMSNDSKLITIYISQNKADILTNIPIIEALLNTAGI